jgi:hypothetical protein
MSWRGSLAQRFQRLPGVPEVRLLYRGLRQTGWVRSAHAGRPFDAAGNPIPWYTYAAISFLDQRVAANHRVFEWGSGNSTAWWARRAGEVVSCDDDPAWARLAATSQATVLTRSLDDGYVEAIRNRGLFDIAVIDGRHRVRCAFEAPSHLADGGVIVWDNADRSDYEEGYRHLLSLGFRRLDFDGFGPGTTKTWRTTVWYRDCNCLEI